MELPTAIVSTSVISPMISKYIVLPDGGPNSLGLLRRPGRELALDPDLAVLEELLLPDGDGALEFAYGPLAGFKRRAAVRGADRDDDRSLADVGAPRAVDDADVRDMETLVRLAPEASHLGERHRGVGFVDEVERAASFRPLACVAVERDGRAAAPRDDAARDGAH